MKKFIIILAIIAIFLSGIALSPYIMYPVQAFRWQSFMGGYLHPDTVIFLPIVRQNSSENSLK